jgi:hypothetical protein
MTCVKERDQISPVVVKAELWVIDKFSAGRLRSSRPATNKSQLNGDDQK